MVPQRPERTGKAKIARVVTGALAALSLLFYVAWEIANRGVYQYAVTGYPFDDADEWRYTACSRLVVHGYRLFDQVFSAQPPLFFLSLSGGMRLFGDSIDGARATEILFGVAGLTATAWVAWELAGPAAGGVAALVLAVSPGFLVYSHAVEAEGPMMAVTTVSLGLALRYRRTGLPALLLASGLALAAATLIKLFALEAIVPVLWLVWVREGRPRRAVEMASVFGAALFIPLALDFALISPQNQWKQVIQLHNRAATIALPNLVPPGTILGRFLGFDLGLSLLALGGLVALALARRWEPLVFLLFWVPGSLVMLFAFRPLFPHHAAILLTGLAVCAGVGVGVAADAWETAAWTPAVPVVLTGVAYLVLVPRLASTDRHTLLPENRPAIRSLASYVRRSTGPADFVAADDLEVADRAGRLVPAPLCDPSNVRLLAGYLTAGDLMRATEEYRTTMVIPSRGIYAQEPAYLAWVREHYRPQRAPGGVTAYRRR